MYSCRIAVQSYLPSIPSFIFMFTGHLGFLFSELLTIFAKFSILICLFKHRFVGSYYPDISAVI